MEQRSKYGYWVQEDLRGRTLRHIADGGDVLHAICEDRIRRCANSKMWLPFAVLTDPHIEAYRDRDVDEFARKLRCGTCGSSTILLTKVDQATIGERPC